MAHHSAVKGGGGGSNLHALPSVERRTSDIYTNRNSSEFGILAWITAPYIPFKHNHLAGMQGEASGQEGKTVQTEWLTANEAAQYLKIKPRTLLQWAREKKIPSHRLSGVERCVWRFLRGELDAMLMPSSADPAEWRQQ